MAARLPEFTWQQPIRGGVFAVETLRFPPEQEPTEQIVCRRPERLRPYQPLSERTGLFLEFAETPPTAEGVLAFANRYGHLGQDYRLQPGVEPVNMRPLDPTPPPERLRFWQSEILAMQEAVAIWEAARAGNQEGIGQRLRWEGDQGVQYLGEFLDRPVPAPLDIPGAIISKIATPTVMGQVDQNDLTTLAGLLLVNHHVTERMRGWLALELIWDPRTRQTSLVRWPVNLLAAMYLQFAEAIAGNKQYRRCRECNRPFELSPAVNRAHRISCSDSCRYKGYVERQDRARQLHTQGKTFRQIAKLLDSDTATVKRWITGIKG